MACRHRFSLACAYITQLVLGFSCLACAAPGPTRSLLVASTTFARGRLHQDNNTTAGNPEAARPGSSLNSVCGSYGLEPRKQISSEGPPRVMDCFLASNEVDMMEIRLRELETVVDVFVIVESRMTFRAKPKKLHYPKIINRLPADLIRKIRYVVLDSLEGDDAWAKEAMQRNALFKHAAPRSGDILLVSDCDEIPKPSFLAALKHCDGVQYPLSMQAAHHYYSYDLVSSKTDKTWYHPRATKYTPGSKVAAHQLRVDKPAASYPNSSWHCSSCFKSLSAIQVKIRSFSHSEFDTPEHTNPDTIASRVRKGQDLFNRPQMQFEKDNSTDMPAYIKAHPTRFSYLISRGVPDAGFNDLGLPLD